jgi:hypothetical protein
MYQQKHVLKCTIYEGDMFDVKLHEEFLIYAPPNNFVVVKLHVDAWRVCLILLINAIS